MIPKKIHYIWLGGRPKSKLTEICINSWRRVLSDYEIIEWNETNIDLKTLCQQNKFLKRCYDLKLWAFVSDYLRLYILYNEGGIYLDTDVEVLKSYSDLLSNEMFIGHESGNNIATAVIGAKKNNLTIKKLLEFYDSKIWDVDLFVNTVIFRYVLENQPGVFYNCLILPQEYFSPYEPNISKDGVVELANTYSIHWFTANWNMSRKGYIFLTTKHIKNPIKRFFVSIKRNAGYLKRKFLFF